MKQFIILAALLTLFASCAIHTGTVSSTSFEAPHKTVGTVIGSSRSVIIFGFGGLRTDALIYTAKKRMQQSRELIYDERLANFTVDIKRTYWPFALSTKVIVSADVVKLLGKSDYVKVDSIATEQSPNEMLFSVGDTVYLMNKKRGIILNSTIVNGKISVAKIITNHIISVRNIALTDVFVTKLGKKRRGIEVGTKVELLASNIDHFVSEKNASVIGIGLNQIMIQTNKSKQKMILHYSQVKSIQ